MSRWRKKAVYKVELLEGREKKTKGFWGKLGDEVIPPQWGCQNKPIRGGINEYRKKRWNKKGQISRGLAEKDY